MLKEKFTVFLNAGIQTESYYETRRLYMTNALVLTMAIAMFLFALINSFIFYRPNLVFIDMLAAVISTYTLIQLRRDKNLQKATTIAVYSVLFISIAFGLLNQNHNFGLIWTIFLPLFAMSLKGHKTGLKITLIYYTIMIPAVYLGIGTWQNGDWNEQSAMRYTTASAALVFVVFMYELSLYNFNEQERETKKQLKHLSRIDALTGLYNRRAINHFLEIEIEKSIRYQTPLSIIVFDLDNFKQINDQYGHLKGDEVLQETSKLMLNNLRKTEALGRWGGEEFILICPQLKLQEAYNLAEKARRLIADLRFDHLGQITASFGVAQFTESLNSQTLVAQADKVLYQAKNNGKNKVEIFQTETI